MLGSSNWRRRRPLHSAVSSRPEGDSRSSFTRQGSGAGRPRTPCSTSTWRVMATWSPRCPSVGLSEMWT
jgi:hypothetical protein